ncbi:sensor of ECF-type sigma factor [Gaetbulibacter sp. PBL-D1]|uniref:sensor of ECF-type sigma factor n=1 Tax=Gaetbulibacter sp. PBL-D1 TaxID=3422594 RepID=UPI003D2F4920
MKKLIVSLCFICLFATAFSQSHEEKKERINALKIAFITEHLNLTESEAQKFWPIYNAYEEKDDQLKKTSANTRKRISLEFDSLSNKEAESLLNDVIENANTRHKLHVNYINSLREVFSAKKIILLKQIEDDFKRKMFEEFKKRRQERKNKP